MNQKRHCSGGQLPDCKVRGATAWLPEVPEECRAAAAAAGKELCVTHAGESVVNQLAGVVLNLTINLPKCREFWAQAFIVSVFDTGVNTPVLNGHVVDVTISGSSQFAGSLVSLSTYSPAMPFLGVAWDVATPSNPINISLLARAAGNIDVQVSCIGYAIR